MNLESSNNLCRICLKGNVFFEWFEAIFEFSGPSYKECYYQYTCLQEEDKDPYTQMLCPDCANDLRNTYLLVEKALASNKKLKEHKTYVNGDDSFKERDMHKVYLPDTIDSLYENTGETKVELYSTEVKILNTYSGDEIQNESNVLSNEDSSSFSESDCHNIATSTHKGLSLMCMYCSKICKSQIKLRNHERTHEKRERTESCPICGLKFFDQTCLKSHMLIHSENRERKYKCEFCIKSFFARGALNVHRRIHLGQMVKCQLCPKEYNRQVDLDNHMRSHNIVPVTLDEDKKSRTKHFMDCKTCGKKVSWRSWEIHKAKHLNQPLFQCSICGKDYYTRKSLCRHLNKIHNASLEQYDDFIIKFNQKFKPRFTSLMKEQNIVIE